MKGFVPELTDKSLTRVHNNWYASDGVLISHLSEEIVSDELYFEGATRSIKVNHYERSATARAICIEHHVYLCCVCGFDFAMTYGRIGENYIHVHHVVPLSEVKEEYQLDPITDLIPVCPNCHAIIHKTQPALTVEQLKRHLKN